MATDPSTIAPPAPAPADPNAEIYDAIRKADAAGDADAVARLYLYLKQKQAPAPITDSGTTQGFADEAPPEASRQLSPEDTATFYKMLRGDGAPKASADELRRFVGSKGLSLNNAEQIVAQRDKGQGVVGQIDYPLPKVVNTDGGSGAFRRGVEDTLTFGVLPKIGAVTEGVNSALHGGNFGDAYHEQIDVNNGQMASDEGGHPWMRLSGQLLGGLAIPIGLEGVGLKAGTEALRAGASIDEARAAASIAVRNRIAVSGGTYGAAHGALSADNLPDAAKGAAVEGTLGAAGGLAFGTAGQYLDPTLHAARLANRALPVSDAERLSNQVISAADQEEIPISRAYVDPTVRNKLTHLETTKGGNAPVRQGLNDVSGALEDRTVALGRDGTPVNSEVGGEKIQNAGIAFIRDSGKRSSRLYTRAQALSGDTKVVPQRALDTIDAQLADLKQAPETNKAVISYLTGLRSDLARPGGLGIQTLRDIRTGVRGNINQANLTQTNAERLAGDALKAASSDISAALSPEARAAYNAADTNYAERMDTINNVVKGFLGPRNANISPEKAFAKFKAMASPKGDNARMSAMLKLLPDDDAADIAATFASELGRSTKGDFSPTLLVSQAQRLPKAAAENLFGQEGEASLRRLVTISKQHAAIVGNLNNSRTAVAQNYRSWIARSLGLVGGGAGGFLTHGPSVGLIAAYGASKAAGAANDFADTLSARALMNTDLSKWIVRSPATSDPQKIRKYISLLSGIAAKNPPIANDVLHLQERLASAFRPQSLAAQPEDHKK